MPEDEADEYGVGGATALSTRTPPRRAPVGGAPAPHAAAEATDGTELDEIEDLPVNKAREALQLVASPLTSSPARPRPDGRSSDRRGSPSKAASGSGQRTGRGPTLLKASDVSPAALRTPSARARRPRFAPPPLTPPNDFRWLVEGWTCAGSGDMVYDPERQVWVGNEGALKAFDRAETTATRKGLIANLGRANVPQVVGQMVYDPEKMVWRGNDEDGELFDGLVVDDFQELPRPGALGAELRGELFNNSG